MDMEVSGLEQQALLWSATGAIDVYGESAVGSPQLIPVRWNGKRRVTLDAKGNQVTLDATAVVDRRIAPESRIWLCPGTYVAGTGYPAADPAGGLANWLGTGSGGGPSYPDDELMLVKSYDETPDAKGRTATRTIGMVRYKSKP